MEQEQPFPVPPPPTQLQHQSQQPHFPHVPFGPRSSLASLLLDFRSSLGRALGEVPGADAAARDQPVAANDTSLQDLEQLLQAVNSDDVRTLERELEGLAPGLYAHFVASNGGAGMATSQSSNPQQQPQEQQQQQQQQEPMASTAAAMGLPAAAGVMHDQQPQIPAQLHGQGGVPGVDLPLGLQLPPSVPGRQQVPRSAVPAQGDGASEDLRELRHAAAYWQAQFASLHAAHQELQHQLQATTHTLMRVQAEHASAAQMLAAMQRAPAEEALAMLASWVPGPHPYQLPLPAVPKLALPSLPALVPMRHESEAGRRRGRQRSDSVSNQNHSPHSEAPGAGHSSAHNAAAAAAGGSPRAAAGSPAAAGSACKGATEAQHTSNPFLPGPEPLQAPHGYGPGQHAAAPSRAPHTFAASSYPAKQRQRQRQQQPWVLSSLQPPPFMPRGFPGAHPPWPHPGRSEALPGGPWAYRGPALGPPAGMSSEESSEEDQEEHNPNVHQAGGATEACREAVSPGERSSGEREPGGQLYGQGQAGDMDNVAWRHASWSSAQEASDAGAQAQAWRAMPPPPWPGGVPWYPPPGVGMPMYAGQSPHQRGGSKASKNRKRHQHDRQGQPTLQQQQQQQDQSQQQHQQQQQELPQHMDQDTPAQYASPDMHQGQDQTHQHQHQKQHQHQQQHQPQHQPHLPLQRQHYNSSGHHDDGELPELQAHHMSQPYPQQQLQQQQQPQQAGQQHPQQSQHPRQLQHPQQMQQSCGGLVQLQQYRSDDAQDDASTAFGQQGSAVLPCPFATSQFQELVVKCIGEAPPLPEEPTSRTSAAATPQGPQDGSDQVLQRSGQQQQQQQQQGHTARDAMARGSGAEAAGATPQPTAVAATGNSYDNGQALGGSALGSLDHAASVPLLLQLMQAVASRRGHISGLPSIAPEFTPPLPQQQQQQQQQQQLSPKEQQPPQQKQPAQASVTSSGCANDSSWQSPNQTSSAAAIAAARAAAAAALAAAEGPSQPHPSARHSRLPEFVVTSDNPTPFQNAVIAAAAVAGLDLKTASASPDTPPMPASVRDVAQAQKDCDCAAHAGESGSFRDAAATPAAKQTWHGPHSAAVPGHTRLGSADSTATGDHAAAVARGGAQGATAHGMAGQAGPLISPRNRQQQRQPCQQTYGGSPPQGVAMPGGATLPSGAARRSLDSQAVSPWPVMAPLGYANNGTPPQASTALHGNLSAGVEGVAGVAAVGSGHADELQAASMARAEAAARAAEAAAAAVAAAAATMHAQGPSTAPAPDAGRPAGGAPLAPFGSGGSAIGPNQAHNPPTAPGQAMGAAQGHGAPAGTGSPVAKRRRGVSVVQDNGRPSTAPAAVAAAAAAVEVHAECGGGASGVVSRPASPDRSRGGSQDLPAGQGYSASNPASSGGSISRGGPAHGRAPPVRHPPGPPNPAVAWTQQPKRSRKHSNAKAHAGAHVHAHAHAHVYLPPPSRTLGPPSGTHGHPLGGMPPPGHDTGPMEGWGPAGAWEAVHGQEGKHGALQKHASRAIPPPAYAPPPGLAAYADERPFEAPPHPAHAAAAAAGIGAEARHSKRSKKGPVQGYQSLPPTALQGYQELHPQHTAHLLAPYRPDVPPAHLHPELQRPRPSLPPPYLPPHAHAHMQPNPHAHLTTHASLYVPESGGKAAAAAAAAAEAATPRGEGSKGEKKRRRLAQHASAPLPPQLSLPRPSIPQGTVAYTPGSAAVMGADGSGYGGGYEGGYAAAPPVRSVYGRPWPGPPAGYAGPGAPMHQGEPPPDAYHAAGPMPMAGHRGLGGAPDSGQGQSKPKKRKVQGVQAAPSLQGYPAPHGPLPCLGQHYGYECPGCPGCCRM